MLKDCLYTPKEMLDKYYSFKEISRTTLGILPLSLIRNSEDILHYTVKHFQKVLHSSNNTINQTPELLTVAYDLHAYSHYKNTNYIGTMWIIISEKIPFKIRVEDLLTPTLFRFEQYDFTFQKCQAAFPAFNLKNILIHYNCFSIKCSLDFLTDPQRERYLKQQELEYLLENKEYDNTHMYKAWVNPKYIKQIIKEPYLSELNNI